MEGVGRGVSYTNSADADPALPAGMPVLVKVSNMRSPKTDHLGHVSREKLKKWFEMEMKTLKHKSW